MTGDNLTEQLYKDLLAKRTMVLNYDFNQVYDDFISIPEEKSSFCNNNLEDFQDELQLYRAVIGNYDGDDVCMLVMVSGNSINFYPVRVYSSIE